MRIDLKEIYKNIRESENNIFLEKNNSNINYDYSKLCISEESILGQFIKEISILVVNGYLRILGGNLIIEYNKYIKEFYPGEKLIVAIDIFGGIYAVSNNDFLGDFMDIWYFTPDLLEWENLQINYEQFIIWACSENILDFYKAFIFKNINLLINELDINKGILIYPFLWSEECNIETSEKKIVPIKEIIDINAYYQNNLIDCIEG